MSLDIKNCNFVQYIFSVIYIAFINMLIILSICRLLYSTCMNAICIKKITVKIELAVNNDFIGTSVRYFQLYIHTTVLNSGNKKYLFAYFLFFRCTLTGTYKESIMTFAIRFI